MITDMSNQSEETAKSVKELAEDFYDKMQIKEAKPEPEGIFITANLSVSPGDVLMSVHTTKARDNQMPIFGRLPARMHPYFDKKAKDYKKRKLSKGN